MQKLIIEDDEGKQVVVPLIRDEITIGRQEGNTIRLTEQNISRRHARLVRDNGSLFIEDLSSYNGVKLNGAKITARMPFNDGDTLLLGDYKLSVKTEAGARTASYADGGAGLRAAAAGGGGAAVRAAMPARVDPVPEPMEGAPTIPVRTLVDQGLVPGMGPASSTAPPGRLVAISTPLAGSEFLLDRPSLVIGRTPENDIILNHKSISRHHAKVIRDGDRYVVVDLESANGVRINGVEQERVELDSGDVIELGHVRLRFVAGDDPYAGNPGLLRFGAGSSHKRAFIIGGAAAAVVVAAAIILAVSGSGDKKPATTVAATTPAAPAAPEPPKPATVNVAGLLDLARAAIREGRWDDATKAVDGALAADPSSNDAKELRKTIDAERGTSERLAEIKKEAEAGNFAAAQALVAALPAGTKARTDAEPLIEQAKSSYIAEHVREADRLRSAGECAGAKHEAELVLAVDARNKAARDAATSCRPAATKVAVAPRPPAPAKTPTPSPPKLPAAPRAVAAAAPAARPAALQPPPTDEGPAGDPDELLQQAQDAWLKGQFAVAIDSSRKALKLRPGTTRAYQIIAVCSCSLKDQDGAAKAYDKLDDKNKKLVKALCQKSGLTLD